MLGVGLAVNRSVGPVAVGCRHSDNWVAVDREEQRVLARREEAQALLRAGLETKERTDRALALGVTATGVAAAAGIANEFEQVMLGVPVALSLLLAYVFQLYTDVIAFGLARSRIERTLAENLGEDVLIAETIAPVRRGGKMNPSLTITQGVYVALIAVSAIVGGVIAERAGTLALILYSLITVLALLAALWSARDMARVWGLAEEQIGGWPRDIQRRDRGD